ncbi:MAG: DUF4037 domain-containing protein, partial [Oscillospiraceae bacterium]|nr:DUF4037 domain-containing protein [Oscillospiraceae bacterium]
MTEKSINYFNNIIMPSIREKYSDIMPEMTFYIHGSVGLGIDDELSDVEAIIHLPDDLWKKRGGYLQIDLDKLLLETNLWSQPCSIICVHPLSWMINGDVEKIISGEADIPWSELSFETLFNMQNDPIWHDPKDRYVKLRRMTAPENMPEIMWKKALLEKIRTFVSDGMQEIHRCIDRKHYLDAYIPFGDAVKALLEIGFMVCRQYYPYRKHLSWAFNRLPSPISDLKPSFDLLSVAENWQERISIMETIYNFYRDYIISNSLLPELDFNRVDLVEMPLHDNEFNTAKWILDNPNSNWRAEHDALMEKTLKLGFEPEAARWIDWWEIDEPY